VKQSPGVAFHFVVISFDHVFHCEVLEVQEDLACMVVIMSLDNEIKCVCELLHIGNGYLKLEGPFREFAGNGIPKGIGYECQLLAGVGGVDIIGGDDPIIFPAGNMIPRYDYFKFRLTLEIKEFDDSFAVVIPEIDDVKFGHCLGKHKITKRTDNNLLIGPDLAEQH